MVKSFSAVQLGLVLLCCTAAGSATTIDFEAQGVGAASAFSGTLNSPLTIGIATFTGGQLLKNEAGGPDLTTVYATTGNLTAYTDPLVITFAQPVNNVSLLVTNFAPDTYTLSDNLGGSEVLGPLNAGTSQTFSLADTGITRLLVTAQIPFGWDFAIDNVTFSQSTNAIPEPATVAPIAGGILYVLYRLKTRKLSA